MTDTVDFHNRRWQAFRLEDDSLHAKMESLNWNIEEHDSHTYQTEAYNVVDITWGDLLSHVVQRHRAGALKWA